MKYLLTMYDRICTMCKGEGHRRGEDFACPHCDGKKKEPVAQVVNGHLYKLFPNEPAKIENDFHARHILEQKHYRGAVEIKGKEREGALGIDFDVEGAKEDSLLLIRNGYQSALDSYVQNQIQRRQQNLAVLPPSGTAAEAVDVLGVDLAKYGLNPVGYKIGEQAEAREKEMADMRTRNELLERQLLAQAENIDKLSKMVEALMSKPEADDDDKSKSKKDAKKAS